MSKKNNSKEEYAREVVEYGLRLVGGLVMPADPFQIALALGLRIVPMKTRGSMLCGDSIMVSHFGEGALKERVALMVAWFLLRDQGLDSGSDVEELHDLVTAALLAYDETKRGQRLSPADVIDFAIARRLAHGERIANRQACADAK